MAGLKIPRLPPRRKDTQKGDYGKVLLVAGSRGMAGAATLAAQAAYRGGAGLVYLAVPDSLVSTIAVKQTCGVVFGLPDQSGGLGRGAANEIARLEERADVVAVGPGLGVHAETVEEVRRVFGASQRPMVVDADGLNAFIGHPDLLAEAAGTRLLTPHPGELSRLILEPAAAINRHRVRVAEAAAKRFKCILVLKGHRTVVTDGHRTFVNDTGNPGMATGGSGDVLTGLMAALVGQLADPFEAAILGVHLHGLAGDIAARKLGMVSLMATDLLDSLPFAILGHQGRRQ
ncbi:MAG: NAD(P)H-hydrate dehydratase [Planctomycetes bacterium]|nr:NAD(P)H-hydrate dehydratase [Planctomycetota bacterium]